MIDDNDRSKVDNNNKSKVDNICIDPLNNIQTLIRKCQRGSINI